MNEHSPSASEDPALPGDSEPAPEPTATRSRRLPRAGHVAAAATSRTAGWMVAAALAGSLVTLVLVPNRNSQTTVVPFRGTAFAGPGGIHSAVPGKRFAIKGPSPAQIGPVPAGGGRAFRMIAPWQQAFPGQARVYGPAMTPACAYFGPGGLPPGTPPAFVRLGGPRHVIKGEIVQPGVPAKRLRIVQLPATKRLSWVQVPSRIARRLTITLGPGGKALAGPGAFTFVGPGGPGGPGCAIQGVGAPGTWRFVPAPGPARSWYVPAPSRTSWYYVP